MMKSFARWKLFLLQLLTVTLVGLTPFPATADTVIKSSEVTLTIPKGGVNTKDALRIRKSTQNWLTEYYATTATDLDAGPSLGWSLEIESTEKPKTPLQLTIKVTQSFLEKINKRFKLDLFRYFLADSAEDTIAYLEPVPFSFDQKENLLKIKISPELFRKYEGDENYLLLLIVGSTSEKTSPFILK